MPRMSRPTILTPEIAAAVCERLAEFGSLRRVCREPDMPLERTVRLWCAQSADFESAYARSKAIGIDALVEEGMDIVDEAPPTTAAGATDTGHVAWSKSRAEYRRWLAERMAPKKYGATQKVTGAEGGPVKQSIVITTGVPQAGEIDIDDLV